MFPLTESIDSRRLILSEDTMQNLYVTQAVATERIHALQLAAERDRRYRTARGSRPGLRARGAATAMVQLLSQLANVPRRARAFILAGQLRTTMYGTRPC